MQGIMRDSRYVKVSQSATVRDETANFIPEEEVSDTGELTPRQEGAIAALLLCPTVRQAAQKAQVAEGTLFRWLASPTFAQAYKEARDTALQQAMNTLQSTAGAAVTTMLSLMTDTKKPGSVRLAAARSVMEYCFKAKEMQEIEERLQALEEALTASADRKRGVRY
jgi:hypothetical protein